MFEMVKFINPWLLNFRSFEIADSVGGMGVRGATPRPPISLICIVLVLIWIRCNCPM